VAPPRRHPELLAQLGQLAANARREGVEFGEFWPRAVLRRPYVLASDPDPPERCLRWPSDGRERLAWEAALAETVEGWRRAYEGEAATRGELAVSALAAVLREDADEPLLVAA